MRIPHLLLGLLPALLSAAPIKFDIPAQPADLALQRFAQQASAEVAYPAAELRQVQSTALQGEFEPLAGLERLLTGSGYKPRQLSATSFAVSRPPVPKPGSVDGSVRDESGRPVAGAKVALADSDMMVLTDKRGRFFLEGIPAGAYALHITAEGLQNTRVTDVDVKAGQQHTISPITIPVAKEGTLKLDPYVVSAKKNDGVIELDPYSVEGRKEKPFEANLDIPRTINDARAYYIFDAKTIDQSGATNIEDFLKQKLTMNTAAMTYGQTAGLNQRGNTSEINLRGVGADKTLILVNGRRQAGVALGTNIFQPDLNGIPLSAIERVEVLPSSASGIYGGSAIGGVVNVILKKRYSGGEIRLTYDNTFDTDSPRRTASISYGLSLEGGRSHLNLSASWSDTQTLLLQDRVELYRDNLAVIQSNAPTFITSSTNPWLGALPNITPSSASETTLVLKNNGVPLALNSRNTFVPAGTSSTTSLATLSAGLLANAGRWNLDLPPSTQAPTGLLRPFGVTPETRSIQASFRRQMWSRLEAYAEFMFNENKSMSIHNPFNAAFTVQPTAPTNPFTTAVMVRTPGATQLVLPTRSQNRTISLGVMATLPRGWTSLFDYSWSENRYFSRFNSVDLPARTAALASGELNPFVDSLLYPIDFERYTFVSTDRNSSNVHSWSARGSGPLSALPWGTLNLTGGLEHILARTPERTATQLNTVTIANSWNATFYEKESVTTSAYFEALIPLVKDDWFPLLHELELQLTGRADRYKVDTGTQFAQVFYNRTPPQTVYGGTTSAGQPYFSEASYSSHNFTTGLKWEPMEGLTFRLSHATAFLPPTPAQLIKNPAPSSTTTNVTDPRTGLLTPVFTLSGGNPDLKPQNSKSVNLGIIWQPKWKLVEGLRLNAEYYYIQQFDAIGSLSAQQMVNNESSFPDRISRNASGVITQVDISQINLFERSTEGWDFSLDYRRQTPIGTLTISAVESIILHLKQQILLTLPNLDYVGYPSESNGGAAKYKSNLTLGWERKNWSASWSARYFGSYKQSGAAGGPTSIQSNNGLATTTYIPAQGSDTISSQTYHDLVVGYSFREESTDADGKLKKLGHKLTDGLTVQVGLRNAFNKVPPLDVFYSNNYYLSPYGDLRLRSYWLSVRKSF